MVRAVPGPAGISQPAPVATVRGIGDAGVGALLSFAAAAARALPLLAPAESAALQGFFSVSQSHSLIAVLLGTAALVSWHSRPRAPAQPPSCPGTAVANRASCRSAAGDCAGGTGRQPARQQPRHAPLPCSALPVPRQQAPLPTAAPPQSRAAAPARQVELRVGCVVAEGMAVCGNGSAEGHPRVDTAPCRYGIT